MLRIFCVFEIQTDDIIFLRKPDLLIVNKRDRERDRERVCWIVDFAVPTDHRVKSKENKKRYQHRDLAKELKEKLCNMRVTVMLLVISMLGNDPERISKKDGRVGNQRTNRDHPNYNIIEIGQKTKKSPEDFRRLPNAQTPVKDHQLMLVWKTRKDWFGLVWFYGISTIVGCLMPNPFLYIKQFYFKQVFLALLLSLVLFDL